MKEGRKAACPVVKQASSAAMSKNRRNVFTWIEGKVLPFLYSRLRACMRGCELCGGSWENAAAAWEKGQEGKSSFVFFSGLEA